MSAPASIARALLTLLPGLLAGTPVAAGAQSGTPAENQPGGYLAEYKRGVEAYEAGRWREAAEALERAVEGRSEASPRLARKLFLKPYIPHFYLGGAYFHLGDCRRAVAAWEEAERQGVIAGQPQAEELRQRRALCSERLGEHGEALGEAETAVAEARRAFATVSELSNDPELRSFWNRDRSAMAARRRQAEERLADAERRLEQGRDRLSSFVPLRQAASISREARALFDTIAAEAQRHRGSLERRGERQQLRLTDLKEESRGTLQRAAALPADSALLREQRGALRSALEEASRQGDRVTSASKRRLEEALADLLETLEPPAELLQGAAESFLAGSYGEVLVRLTAELPEDARSSAHARLLRAAAAFGLHRSSPAGNPVLLAQARADLLAAAASLPAPPGARLFRPGFRAFCAEVVGEVGRDGTATGTDRRRGPS